MCEIVDTNSFTFMLHSLRRILSVCFLVIISASLSSGQDSVRVSIRGNAYQQDHPEVRLDDLMIINLRTSQGVFGKADGSFQSDALKSDTLLVASTGYEYKRITVKDSILKPDYFINVPLVKLNVKLKEVVVFAPRDLENIYKDIEKLGYNKRDFQIGGVPALQSPITFLYQEFNRLERLKRHNAERINNDKRRELLKELLANYVAGDIINLDNGEFDYFVDFCNVSEEYMKKASQYDFCVYIKQKFEIYAMMKGKRSRE